MAELRDCVNGSRWSKVWNFNSIIVLGLALCNLLLMIGAFQFHTRAVGSCLLCCFSCTHLAAIVMTGVFRFNTEGKLAALSTLPVKYVTTNYSKGQVILDSNRTYESDGNVILGLWIGALCQCCFGCCLGNLMVPKQ